MPLSEPQIARLSELVGRAYPATDAALTAALAALGAAEAEAVEDRLADIIASYDAVRNKHLRMSGGRDGIDIDYGRNRADLKRRALDLLDISGASERPTVFALAQGCRGR